MKSLSQVVGRWGPIVLSVAALVLVLTALAAGWERGERDEGAVAHTWQLLMALQAPLVFAFLASANWRRPGDIAKVIAVQEAAFGAALAPVALLRL
jgi:hypothetical protein